MIDIVNKLYKVLKNPTIKDIRKPTSLYPSSARLELSDGTVYGACRRAEVYRYAGVEKDDIEIEPNYILKSIAGDALHESLAALFRKYTYQTNLDVLAVEHRIYLSDLNLSGRTDIIFLDRDTNKIAICDFKTVGEYKAGTVIDQPSIEHILQCITYIYAYNKLIENNESKISEAIILYLARVDTYRTKHKRHGSPFTDLWQCNIRLDALDGHVIVTSMYGSNKHYNEIKIDDVIQSYKITQTAIDLFMTDPAKPLPKRDFELTYSEDKLVALSKAGSLNKENTKKVDTWLNKGAKEGELLKVLNMGDFECRTCSWVNTCWQSKTINELNKSSSPINIQQNLIIKKDIQQDYLL